MTTTINFVVCSKGGDGKTTLTLALYMIFLQAGFSLVLIDADGNNPTLAPWLGDEVPVEVATFSDDLAQVTKIDIIFQQFLTTPDSFTLVDVGANCIEPLLVSFRDAGLEELCQDKNYQVNIFWPIANQVSLPAALSFFDAIPPNARKFLLRNEGLGQPFDFEELDMPEVQAQLTQRGVIQLTIPALAPKVLDHARTNKASFMRVSNDTKLSALNRSRVFRFIEALKKQIIPHFTDVSQTNTTDPDKRPSQKGKGRSSA